MLCFGVFRRGQAHLLGAITFSSGPTNAYRLLDGSKPGDSLTLSRLWLSEELPANSESRTIGVTLRALKRFTSVKFIVTYADPAQGHVGTIYQATGWTYTGLSQATPRFDVGDGKARHSRSVAHAFGSRSLKFLKSHGVTVKVLPQHSKHRYLYFLDKDYRNRLIAPVLPYPKREI